jgi:hypothetical protein
VIRKFIVATPKLRDSEFAKFVLYWRLRLLNRDKEADDFLQAYKDESVLDEKLKGLVNGRMLRYSDWPDLLVRALFSGSARVDELERSLTTDIEGSSNPLRSMRGQASYRLADLYFYKALMDTIREPPDRRESTIRSGLQKVFASNAPTAIEFAMAKGLLKRSDIVKSMSLSH